MILEKAMATHPSTLAWKIPWTEGPGGLQSMGLLGVGHDWTIWLSLFTFMHWMEKGMATHSSVLTWRIPWTKEPGGLQSVGFQRVGHNWVINTQSYLIETILFSSYALEGCFLWGWNSWMPGFIPFALSFCGLFRKD